MVHSNMIDNEKLIGPKPQSQEDAASKADHQRSTEYRVTEISSLLKTLENAANESGLSVHSATQRPNLASQRENQLAQVRLGVANSLFTALRHKHPQLASHSLRVALGCSAWAIFAELDNETRDVLELTALMHDIGKIGIPDNILLKPSRLTAEEMSIFNRQQDLGLEILSSCCSSERVMNVFRYARSRYDGYNSNLPLSGEEIPLEARMITIVDTFDAMTTDHVYCPARPRELALNEMFEYAGKQFDPNLVKEFSRRFLVQQDMLNEKVTSRWLHDLATESPQLPWLLQRTASNTKDKPDRDTHSPFEEKLINAMHDGVFFVDAQAKIFQWSNGAQRLTGISSEAALGKQFSPGMLDLRSHSGRHVLDAACPVARALSTTSQFRHRMQIRGKRGRYVAIDLHVIPVHGNDGVPLGATVLMHDAQPEVSLEEKCEVLHAEVAKDPMTKVANRAEFDRVQSLLIEAHNQAGLPLSLIMLDIDHFKNINDTYGHQSGDTAIITVANLLQASCRTGDLVARYGGEEFAVLCSDCGITDASKRAEQLCHALAESRHAALENNQITASFGVTELQSGDTCETMLRRADRALLMAKEQGRNQVVQLGEGMNKKSAKRKLKWWQFGKHHTRPVIETAVTTAVPIDVAIEKLRGFVSDHKTKIVSTEENCVELEFSSGGLQHDSRRNGRIVPFRVKLVFEEDSFERSNNSGLAHGTYVRTCIHISIRPKRNRKPKRNRRKDETAERARMILQSLKAYMMAKEANEEMDRSLELFPAML